MTPDLVADLIDALEAATAKREANECASCHGSKVCDRCSGGGCGACSGTGDCLDCMGGRQ